MLLLDLYKQKAKKLAFFIFLKKVAKYTIQTQKVMLKLKVG